MYNQGKEAQLLESINKLRVLDKDYQNIERQKEQRLHRDFSSKVTGLEEEKRRMQLKLSQAEILCQ